MKMGWLSAKAEMKKKANMFPKTKKFKVDSKFVLFCMIHLKAMDNKVCWDCVDELE
jgi:hypothetical protein